MQLSEATFKGMHPGFLSAYCHRSVHRGDDGLTLLRLANLHGTKRNFHNPDWVTEQDMMYDSGKHCHQLVMYMELTVCSLKGLFQGLFPSGPDGPLDK